MTKKPDYSGMTVNERLFTNGTLDAFDEALRRADRAAAISLLLDVDVDNAERTVDTALADPQKYLPRN